MAARTSSVAQRRKVRALEARRDQLIETKEKTTKLLAVVRAELKHQRKAGTS